MKTVVIGSTNPVKIATTEEAFCLVFPHEQFEFVSCKAESGVHHQPFGDEETKRGAQNRAQECSMVYPHADYFVGLEGGIMDTDGEMWAFAWMCVLGADGTRGLGRSSSFLLPPKVTSLIRGGMELGDASDSAFEKHNSKQNNGTIGILTNDLITRRDFYRDAVIFALIPFLNSNLYRAS